MRSCETILKRFQTNDFRPNSERFAFPSKIFRSASFSLLHNPSGSVILSLLVGNDADNKPGDRPMTSTITIVTTAPERRQIARVLEFTPQAAKYIDWNAVATAARELGAHFEARHANDGACTITFFWAYADGE
jgi:hypothetical protein